MPNSDQNRVLTWAAAACLMLPTAGAWAQTPPATPAAATAASPAAAPAATPTQYRDALGLIEAWLEAQVAYDKVPALSAAAVVGQQLVWSKAWGHVDYKRDRPAQTDTLYGICSISKLFTSVAAMQLWEQGKLSLDDDIVKYLPGFAIQRSDPDSGPISVRALLTHSAGLPREAVGQYWRPPEFKFPTRADLLAGAAGQTTFMRTSDHFQYSNLGLTLVGEVILDPAVRSR